MKFKFDILGTGGINCLEENCPHTRTCPNHTTAGDFRSEDGNSPNMFIEDGFLQCSRTLTNERGMLYLALERYKPF